MNSIKKTDNQIYNIIQSELKRQRNTIELIASENFASNAVIDSTGSILTNKYAEGYPGKRYYGGCESVDMAEDLARDRLKRLFNAEYANVQPHSGSQANMGVFNVFLNHMDTVMGLDLAHGGHLTHGSKVNFSGNMYNFVSYSVSKDTGRVDFDDLWKKAKEFKPKLIICGGSAYPRFIEFDKFKEIADRVGAHLMGDVAHPSGLIASGVHPSPWPYCDVITSTTHKTLRGPRSGMIFFKRELEERINFAVFPGLQGGPHNHQVAGVATQLLEAQQPEFKEYIQQVKKNAKVLGNYFMERGYNLVTNGTDNHLILVDLRNKGVSGSKAEYVCEKVDISLNKNSVFGDTSAINPGGVRIGTSALTTRGFTETDFLKVGELLHKCFDLCINVQEKSGKKLVDFKKAIENDFQEDINVLRDEVNTFAEKFEFIEDDN